jgi:hypothetical protein
MEKDRKISRTGGSGASSERRSAATSKQRSSEVSASRFQELKKNLQDLPDSRPEAVALAKKLIADPDYPSPHTEEIVAEHLAAKLTTDTDRLPT